MTIGYGLLLFFLGSLITIIGFYIAYNVGSRPLKKKDKSSVLSHFLN